MYKPRTNHQPEKQRRRDHTDYSAALPIKRTTSRHHSEIEGSTTPTRAGAVNPFAGNVAVRVTIRLTSSLLGARTTRKSQIQKAT